MEIKHPPIEKCKFTLDAKEDDFPVMGNVSACGDKAIDEMVEQRVYDRLENGDIWAWASVVVTCEYEGFRGRDYLGGCNYANEEDFVSSDYYEDMKKAAYEDMINEIDATARRLSKLEA